MTGIQYALQRVHHGENGMAREMLRLAETHAAEHEVHHVAIDLAGFSQQNLALLAKAAAGFDLDLEDEPDGPHHATQRLRSAMSTALGRRKEPGLLLLHDLADLYLRASDNSLAWEMLAQVAQAKRERELLELAQAGHPQTLRQLKWCNTMIKTQSPQILSSL